MDGWQKERILTHSTIIVTGPDKTTALMTLLVPCIVSIKFGRYGELKSVYGNTITEDFETSIVCI